MRSSIRDFDLGPELGRGAAGRVLEARHRATGEPVAIKLAEPASVLEFEHEVRTIAGLDHPHIVPVYDYGRVRPEEAAASGGSLQPGEAWMAMALAEGTLNTRRGQIAWPELEPLLLAVLDALAHAHAHAVVHRDVKPTNVLLRGADEVFLADFGISWKPGATFEALGTPGYMAPELLRGDPAEIGPHTDLYGLGALAWAMLCGPAPFRGQRAGISRLQAAPRLTRPAPEGVQAWLDRLMAVDPARRFRSAAQARAALDQLAGRTPPDRTTWPERPLRPALRNLGLGLVGLRPLPLVGRERERQELWKALRRAKHQARGVVLHGPAGVGKSRLAAWLGVEASVADLARPLLLRASGAPGDELRGALEGLLGTRGLSRREAERRLHYLHVRDELPDDIPRLLGLLRPGPGEDPGSEEDLHRFARHVVDRACGDRIPLVLVDDAHRSAAAVRFGLRWLEKAPRGLALFTVREGEPGSEQLLDQLRGCARALRVHRLPRQAEKLLLSRGASLGPALTERVQELAEGNPLVASQLLGHWVSSGDLVGGSQGFELSDSAELPRDVTQIWERRIQRALDGQQGGRQILEIVALSGTDPQREEVREAARRAGLEGADEVLDQALRAGLFRSSREGRLHATHGLLLETLRASIQEHQALERAIAEALRALHRPAHRVAPHLERAGMRAQAARAWLVGARDLTMRSEQEALAICLDGAERCADAIHPDEPFHGLLTYALIRAELDARLLRHPRAVPMAASLLERARRQGWLELEILALHVLSAKDASHLSIMLERAGPALESGTDPMVPMVLAEAAIRLGQSQLAPTWLREGGRRYAAQGHEGRALFAHLQASAMDPSDQGLEERIRAARACIEVLRFEGLLWMAGSAWNTLGEFLRRGGQREEAIAAYARSAREMEALDLQSCIMRFNEALNRLELGDQGALAGFEGAAAACLERGPVFMEVPIELGRLVASGAPAAPTREALETLSRRRHFDPSLALLAERAAELSDDARVRELALEQRRNTA